MMRPLLAAAAALACAACQPEDPAAEPDPPDAVVEVDAAPDAAPDAEVDAAPDAAPMARRFIEVGSFNIDWLADEYQSEYTPRLAADYAMIAQLIAETGVEVFGLQEIEGDGALALLGLPERYRWHVGASGWSQNPAILWDAERVAVHDAREIRLPGTDFPSKDPLAARVRSLDGDLEFTLVVVHFNPFANTEDATYRAHQIAELHRWLTDGLPGAPPPAPPVVVVGDFNDTRAGLHREIDALAPLEGDPRFVFVEDDCPESSQTRFDSRIDHLVIDAALEPRLPGDDEGPACTVFAWDDRNPYAGYAGGFGGRSNISSHRPLWMALGVD